MKPAMFMPILLFAVVFQALSCKHQPHHPELLIISGLKDANPRILIGAPVETERGFEKYLTTFKTEFNTGQAQWYATWGGWLDTTTYDFKTFNDNVNWMKANNIDPTMHMMFGPDLYMPEWLVKGSWENAQLDTLMQHMIYNIMDTNDNKSKVEAWVVVNELFDDDGTYRTDMVWQNMGWETDKSGLTDADHINTKHPLFIRKAFAYCREKTNKKLEIRDFNLESDDPTTQNYRKNKALYQLVKHMINEQIPIDVIGIQGHMSVGENDWVFNNNMLRETVKKYKSLGVEVHITELDIRTNNKPWTAALAEQQKQDYYNYVKQAIEGGANRISFWGVQDAFDPNWLLTEHPLLFDKNLEKKPAYLGVKAALEESK